MRIGLFYQIQVPKPWNPASDLSAFMKPWNKFLMPSSRDSRVYGFPSTFSS
jgi:hypothetical protein